MVMAVELVTRWCPVGWPQEHPLRPIRKLVDEIFRAMGKEFGGLYAKTGRPSIPPERLLRYIVLS